MISRTARLWFNASKFSSTWRFFQTRSSSAQMSISNSYTLSGKRISRSWTIRYRNKNPKMMKPSLSIAPWEFLLIKWHSQLLKCIRCHLPCLSRIQLRLQRQVSRLCKKHSSRQAYQMCSDYTGICSAKSCASDCRPPVRSTHMSTRPWLQGTQPLSSLLNTSGNKYWAKFSQLKKSGFSSWSKACLRVLTSSRIAISTTILSSNSQSTESRSVRSSAIVLKTLTSIRSYPKSNHLIPLLR